MFHAVTATRNEPLSLAGTVGDDVLLQARQHWCQMQHKLVISATKRLNTEKAVDVFILKLHKLRAEPIGSVILTFWPKFCINICINICTCVKTTHTMFSLLVTALAGCVAYLNLDRVINYVAQIRELYHEEPTLWRSSIIAQEI